MKVSKYNQSKVSIKFKNPWTHMIKIHIDLKSLLFMWFKDKRQMNENLNNNKKNKEIISF